MIEYWRRMYADNLTRCGGFVPEETRLAVKRGAELLDENRPGWWKQIDLDELQLIQANQCVLGQVFDEPVQMPQWQAFGYTSLEAMRQAKDEDGDPMWPETFTDDALTRIVCEANYFAGRYLLGLDDAACVANGFLSVGSSEDQKVGYAALDVAWADLIRERQTTG